MKYEAVYLYNNSNEFIGASIKSVEGDRLHSVNIWTNSPEDVEDFRKTLAGLNDEQWLRQYWPDAEDPAVLELVESDWEPLELHEQKVIDWDNSQIVMVKQPVWGFWFNSNAGPVITVNGEEVPEGAVEPAPNPDTGIVEWEDTQEIDNEASTFAHKMAMMPEPNEAQARFFKAQEIVARSRALAAME